VRSERVSRGRAAANGWAEDPIPSLSFPKYNEDSGDCAARRGPQQELRGEDSVPRPELLHSERRARGETLDAGHSPRELCFEVHPDETRVRTILGCLELRGEETIRPVQNMSAGKRARVALARLLLRGANLLFLDELTNRLDIGTREALETTVSRYPGTLLFVSHDRYFIRALADEVLDLTPTRKS